MPIQYTPRSISPYAEQDVDYLVTKMSNMILEIERLKIDLIRYPRIFGRISIIRALIASFEACEEELNDILTNLYEE